MGLPVTPRERAHVRLDREMGGRWHVHAAAYDYALAVTEECERLRDELEAWKEIAIVPREVA